MGERRDSRGSDTHLVLRERTFEFGLASPQIFGTPLLTSVRFELRVTIFGMVAHMGEGCRWTTAAKQCVKTLRMTSM